MKSSRGFTERKNGARPGHPSHGLGWYDTTPAPAPCKQASAPKGVLTSWGWPQRRDGPHPALPGFSLFRTGEDPLTLNSKCNRTIVYNYIIYKWVSFTFRLSAINHIVDPILFFFPIFLLLLEAMKSQSWIFLQVFGSSLGKVENHILWHWP